MKELSKNIKTLQPGLIESGKIKIGRKGATRKTASGAEFQLPQKSDHFTITTLERDDTGNFKKDEVIHKLLKSDKPTRIPIMLLFDDVEKNFQSRFTQYQGKTCVCTGDGEVAIKDGKQIECSCEKSKPDYAGKDKCKMNGTLSVMIRDVKRFGSCWKFRTTGFNSIQGIYSSLFLIKKMTGGILSGIDLDLVMSPKTGVNPKDGSAVTVYVVGIEYNGSMAELKLAGVETLKLDATTRNELKQLESGETPDLIEDDLTPDEIQEFNEEFNPEQVEGYVEPEVNLDDVNHETGEVTEQEEPEVVNEPEPVKQPESGKKPTLLF